MYTSPIGMDKHNEIHHILVSSNVSPGGGVRVVLQVSCFLSAKKLIREMVVSPSIIRIFRAMRQEHWMQCCS